MDKITLKNLMFYGYHGVHHYERQHGVRLFFDLELFLDLSVAGKSDDLTKTVDYTTVYFAVKNIVEQEKFQLLEALAEKIAQTMLAFKGVELVMVKIRKPQVPLPGQIDYMEIEITRSRSNL